MLSHELYYRMVQQMQEEQRELAAQRGYLRREARERRLSLGFALRRALAAALVAAGRRLMPCEPELTPSLGFRGRP